MGPFKLMSVPGPSKLMEAALATLPLNERIYSTLRQTKLRENPKPQCAFENLVLGVSSNSHRLTYLTTFFIDLRAE